MGAHVMTSSNVQIIEQLYESFARGDIARVLGAMDPQVEWTSAEGSIYPGTFVGPDAVLNNVFARLGSEWEGFQAAATEFLDAGETVVALGRYSGMYRETGRSMSAAFAHVWTMREGRIVRYRQYVDTRKIAEVL